MILPDGLDPAESFIYRTGMIARAEVWLFHANEQLHFNLIGRESRAMSVAPHLHSRLIAANEAMIVADPRVDGKVEEIALALFVRSRAAIKVRNKIVHGAFVSGDRDPTLAININVEERGNARWTPKRFAFAYLQLRRAAIATLSLANLFDENRSHRNDLADRSIANDHFVLHANGSWMASTSPRTIE